MMRPRPSLSEYLKMISRFRPDRFSETRQVWAALIFGRLLSFVTALSLTTLLLYVLLAGQNAQAQADLPADPFVVRIYYNQSSDISRLQAYDVWEYNNSVEKYVLALVDKAAYAQLQAEGWRLSVDTQATSQVQANDGLVPPGYRSVDQLYADMQTLAAAYPTLATVFDYGDSYCKTINSCTMPNSQVTTGYDLLALRITNETIAGSSTISGTSVISGTKPVLFLMANIHAREVTTPELMMRFMSWLLDGYGTNPEATWLVDWHEIWIIPTSNPDGRWIVDLGGDANPYYQRKNARTNGCATWPPNSTSHFGTDLNRNHDFGWGGASNTPCSQTYQGTAAASEPESHALQDLMLALIPDQKGPNRNDPAPADTTGVMITVHSSGEWVLYPWGDTTATAPNYTQLKALSDKMATYNGYTSCQSGATNCLYPTTGATDDWAYGILGIPAYTIEVGTQFMPPYSQVDSIQWPENRPAFIYAAKVARTPYLTSFGPDALNVQTMVYTQTQTASLTATINDVYNGNQSIAAAEYYLDLPPWADGAVAHPLAATDGTFNSTNEATNATLDLSMLPVGQHLVYVRGRDGGNNWGPVTAAFLEVSSLAAPQASFTSSSPDYLGQITSFTDSSIGANLTYAWDFDDGSGSTDANPTHEYAAAGTYTVTLTVTNLSGNDIYSAPVEIMPDNIYIPVVFK
ncbi:MAG: PKD domain-containing protein [Chloroflexi bacterium]|nr:PKD domain-containing protein [Chloroflexota bacterium]MBP8055633.1 PKD domain-containing protein [Chloroflexota bacterium]